MALKLAQFTTLKNTLFLPYNQNPRPIPHLQFLSLNPNNKPLKTPTSKTTPIKCSSDKLYEYERYASVPASQYPKPGEIEWKKELCNSVQLIGIVGAPVQIKHLPSGKVVAWSSLAVKKSQTDTMWINLTFWDELAQVAFEHVEKGRQVYVSGRLVSDTVGNDDDEKKQTYYKVVVQQLNFIERGPPPVPLYNENYNSDTPGRKQSSHAANSTGSIEELWQAFFANPTEWWDNRMNKRSPNYPDFKHKDTGEALWVEGRYNPPWVRAQLDILDSRMESLHEDNSNLHANFMAADNLGPF